MKAPDTININGKTFNKCHVSKKQWDECITPCTFCHKDIQKDCAKKMKPDFCHGQGEHVCYIDLMAIYGED